MKKLLLLGWVIIALMMFSACNSQESPYGEYKYASPENGVFEAPDEFYLEWDIPSVRNIFITREGYYSLPIYRFDTHSDLLHLKEIVGMELIGAEVKNYEYCSSCGTVKSCAHEMYNEAFFDNYSLLIGWCQYDGLVLLENYIDEDGNLRGDLVDYELGYDGSLVVTLQGFAEDLDEYDHQQWIMVAVPKDIIKDCESITFLVKLPNAQIEPPADENPGENPEQNTEQGTEQQ